MKRSKEQFAEMRERQLDDMHFDTMEKFHQEERERLATMMNLIFKN
jgi:hypothetical protein